LEPTVTTAKPDISGQVMVLTLPGNSDRLVTVITYSPSDKLLGNNSPVLGLTEKPSGAAKIAFSLPVIVLGVIEALEQMGSLP